MIRRYGFSALEYVFAYGAFAFLENKKVGYEVFTETGVIGVIVSAQCILVLLIVSLAHIAHSFGVSFDIRLLLLQNTLSVGLIVSSSVGALLIGSHTGNLS